MSFKIMTAKKSKANVQATDDAHIWRSLYGDGNHVSSADDKLSANTDTAGRIVLGDGILCFDGRMVRVYGTQRVNYVLPAEGMYAKYILTCRYTKNEDDTEDVDFICLKSEQEFPTPSTASLAKPPETHDNRIDGNDIADFVLYEFIAGHDGVQKIETKFDVANSMAEGWAETKEDLQNQVEEAEYDLNKKYDNFKLYVDEKVNSVIHFIFIGSARCQTGYVGGITLNREDATGLYLVKYRGCYTLVDFEDMEKPALCNVVEAMDGGTYKIEDHVQVEKVEDITTRKYTLYFRRMHRVKTNLSNGDVTYTWETPTGYIDLYRVVNR